MDVNLAAGKPRVAVVDLHDDPENLVTVEFFGWEYPSGSAGLRLFPDWEDSLDFEVVVSSEAGELELLAVRPGASSDDDEVLVRARAGADGRVVWDPPVAQNARARAARGVIEAALGDDTGLPSRYRVWHGPGLTALLDVEDVAGWDDGLHVVDVVSPSSCGCAQLRVTAESVEWYPGGVGRRSLAAPWPDDQEVAAFLSRVAAEARALLPETSTP